MGEKIRICKNEDCRANMYYDEVDGLWRCSNCEYTEEGDPDEYDELYSDTGRRPECKTCGSDTYPDCMDSCSIID